LYRKMSGRPVPLAGRVGNPVYASGAVPTTLTRFTHAAADIYLVTRLDAFTTDDVLQLIDRGAAPTTEGEIVLDQKGTGADRNGDRWLEQAAEQLTHLGFSRVFLDRTTTVVTRRSSLLGYYSWGSNDPALHARRLELGFVPGAIGATFVSTDARTFRAPPMDWTVGLWTDRANYYAGSPQSLIGDLIREGITGVAGHVAEPYLDATVRPQLLFPAYILGANLAEAFYTAIPYLSWQTLVVGDPLCAPFRRTLLAAADLDPAIDPTTELPRWFSARRLAALEAQLQPPRSPATLIRAEVRMAKGDPAGARGLLEAALQRDADAVEIERALALVEDADHRTASARDHYRHVLQRTPDDALVLNNLAYGLAAEGQLTEALQLAERAVALVPRQPALLDTLAWIAHLRGDNKRARALFDQIQQMNLPSGEMLVHSATVYLALKNVTAARQDLTTALQVEPELAARPEVAQLRNDLK
jgi:uncharacterized protein (TIGR03790 family)